jgi:glycosyltransferase involved in cell wall biosynthesis
MQRSSGSRIPPGGGIFVGEKGREIITGMFNDSYPPIIDGVSIATRNYANWLNRLVGPSCVVTTDVPGYYDSEEFPVYRYFSLPLSARPPYRFGMNFVGEVHEKRRRGKDLTEKLVMNVFDIPFDLVHAHCPFSSGMLARRIATVREIPLVATFHTKFREDFKQSLKGDLLVDIAILRITRFFESADFVWVPSSGAAATLRSYGFRGPIDVMPNGTDLVVPESDLPALRKDGESYLAVPPGVPVLLFVGQHIKEKNLDVLVESLAALAALGQDFRMVFVGDGYHRASLETRVAELGLASRVSFRGVVADRESMKRIYARADMLFFPSLYDTSGLVIMEAAGMRLPSLLIKGSTVSDGVQDGFNGFLAENDPRSISRRLHSALNDRGALGKAAEGAYATLYRTWENVIDEVGDRYRIIVRDWKGRRFSG